jgi:hypothetical protein
MVKMWLNFFLISPFETWLTALAQLRGGGREARADKAPQANVNGARRAERSIARHAILSFYIMTSLGN